MFGTIIGGLLAKLAGLGSAAKVAIATATAALTMTVAGAAAGVLPVSGGPSQPAVTVGATAGGGVTAAGASGSVSADAGVSDQAPGTGSGVVPDGSASVAADADASAETPAVTPTSPAIPSVSIPGVPLPDLSKLADLPKQVLSCFTPVVDLLKNLPANPTADATKIGPAIVGCVSGIVKDLPLPAGISACVSNIMDFVTNLTSQLPTGTPNLGSFNVSSCIPKGLPVPTGLPGGLPFMGSGFSFGR